MKEKFNLIMLVTDEEISAYINKKIINDLKIAENVLTFFSTKEALDYLKLIQDETTYNDWLAPQVIFLDINMPEITGFRFLDEFRNLTFLKHKSIDIVMIFSSENRYDSQNAMNKGCSGYIIKPVTTEKILTQLNKIIER